MERYGEKALSDKELLAVLIRSGTKTRSALDIAECILRSRPEESSLAGLHRMSLEELKSLEGIGRVRAIQIKALAELSVRMSKQSYPQRPVLNSPRLIAEYYMEELRHLEHEELWMLSLDVRGRLLGKDVIFRGAVSACTISPREIFLKALERRAVKMILMHNHPSGSCDPSSADIAITKRIAKVGEAIDIELWDHIIIGDQTWYSLRENDLF